MKKVIPFFILLLLATALAAAWSIPLGTVEEVLPVKVNVTEPGSRELGFSVSDTGAKVLDFGTTFPGTTVIKTVNITRGEEPPAFVTLSPEGAVAPWMEVSGGEFLLVRPVAVKVSLAVPEDALPGTHGGGLRIAYKKTLFSLLAG